MTVITETSEKTFYPAKVSAIIREETWPRPGVVVEKRERGILR